MADRAVGMGGVRAATALGIVLVTAGILAPGFNTTLEGGAAVRGTRAAVVLGAESAAAPFLLVTVALRAAELGLTLLVTDREGASVAVSGFRIRNRGSSSISSSAGQSDNLSGYTEEAAPSS